MIKNNPPDLENFKKVTNGGEFDHHSPEGVHNHDNNRRDFVREEGKNPKNRKLSIEELQIANLIKVKQQNITRSVRGTTASEHIDSSVFADPMSMSGSSLRDLLNMVSEKQREVKAVEEEESNSLLKAFFDKCKSFFCKKHCEAKKNVVVNNLAVNSSLDKAITNVAMHELGELTTPLMLRNIADIDPKFVINPDDRTLSRKPQQSVMV